MTIGESTLGMAFASATETRGDGPPLRFPFGALATAAVGGLLTGYGLQKRSITGKLLTVAGGCLIVAGACHLLRGAIRRVSPVPADGPRAVEDLQEDPIDSALEGSFPASDPPSWTLG